MTEVLTPQQLAIKAHVERYCKHDAAVTSRVVALAVETTFTIYERDRCGLPLPEWYNGCFDEWLEMWQTMPYLCQHVETERIQIVLLKLKK